MVNMQKAALRSEFRSRRAALSNEIRTEWEQMLWGQLFSKLEALKTAKILLFYFPLPHEISLLPIFGYARERGIPGAFPRCGEATGDMDFYFVSSLDELECGKYGIREPKSSAEKVTNFSGAAVFVPALAFDREGYRLGYGGGYYDRFIAAHDVLSVGITYEAFLTDALPRDQYDQAVDLTATEKGIYRNKF